MSSNRTAVPGAQYQGLWAILVFSVLTTVPCCVFLVINGVMLFTLRSKAVFCETSRYVLLYNLLFADTVNLAQSQLLYLIAACRTRLTFPVCALLVMLNNLTNDISPLTLVAMSLERYVAVCFPLRHATVVSLRNTGLAIALVWSISSLSVLTRLLLMRSFLLEEQNVAMKDFCGKESMLVDPVSDLYDRAFTCFLFVAAGVTVSCSYIGVIVAARSASKDKASARKARKTLLLHLLQLGLSLSSTVHNPLLIAVSTFLDRMTLIRIQIILYVCVIIFPRCLSALIYGLRDQSIRPVLIYHLCCRWRSPAAPSRAKVRVVIAS